MDVSTCFVNTCFVINFFIFSNIVVVNVGKNKNIAVSERLKVSLCKCCSPRYIRKYTLFRETDLPNTDLVTMMSKMRLVENNTQAGQQHL